MSLKCSGSYKSRDFEMKRIKIGRSGLSNCTPIYLSTFSVKNWVENSLALHLTIFATPKYLPNSWKQIGISSIKSISSISFTKILLVLLHHLIFESLRSFISVFDGIFWVLAWELRIEVPVQSEQTKESLIKTNLLMKI